ncbi:ankyrin repeat domain-containing protein 26-like [Urocitellus parryii]
MSASSGLKIYIYIRNVNASGSREVYFSTAPHLEITSNEEQNILEGSESNQLLVEEKKMKHPIETKESQNLCERTEDTDYNDEPMEQRKRRKNDHEPFCLTKCQEHDGVRQKASNSKRKVKTPANLMENLDNLSKSCQTASENCELAYPNDKEILQLIEQHKTSCKDSLSLSKIEDAVISSQRTMEHRKCHCSQCLLFIEKACELKIQLLDAKKVNAMLKHEKAEWKQELSNLRCELQEEEKKRKNADNLLEEIKHQLREKEEDYNKEMEIKRQLEMALKTRDMELNTEINKLKQVSTSNKMEKDLLYKCQAEMIARKILEIERIKHENQEKEKKYLEAFEILKGKYDDLQKTIKQKEETAGANPFQDNEQFNKMKDETTTLKFQLQYEKENRERLETELKSYRATLAAAPIHHYEGQTSREYQEFAFQSAREEYLRSQAKMKFAISLLKAHSDLVAERFIKNEKRFCILKNNVRQTRHAVKEMILNLETLQSRDLRQAQCQIKKIKYTYHNEQTKVNKCDGKQDSIGERSPPQTENTLLQQQLHKPHNESVNKDTVISIQQQCRDIGEKRLAETKNHKLINKCDRIEEKLNQYENEKTERTVAVRPLQQERASLEVSSDCHLNLEEETRELRRN